jgi:hypothetical protein
MSGSSAAHNGASEPETAKDETMNILQVIALLAPVVVIAALNVSLYLGGERGTLLLPDRSDYPAVPLESLAVVQGYLASEEETEFEEEMRLAA